MIIKLFQVKLSDEETKQPRAKKKRNKFPCEYCELSYEMEAKLVKHMFAKHPDMQVDLLNSKEATSEEKLDTIEESNLKDDNTAREFVFVEKEEVSIFYLFFYLKILEK